MASIAPNDPTEVKRLLKVMPRKVDRTLDGLQDRKLEAGEFPEESTRWRHLYESILANTPDLGYIFDLNHRFIYANNALLAMWGKTWDEASGKTCLELGYEPWHAAMHDREIERVIATRQPVRGEVPFESTNGRRIYDYIFFPVMGPSGDVEAVAGNTRDITEHKEAEQGLRQSERQYRELLDALPVAVYTTDAEGRITLYNQAAAAFAGRKADIGSDRWCITHRLYRPDGTLLPHDQCPMAVSLLTGTPQRGVEAITERPDGTRAWFIPYPTIVRDAFGEITGGINVLVDITARKRAERLLVEQKQLLEMVAAGRPLDECLTALTVSVTRLLPNARAAVLIADDQRKRVKRAFSAALPFIKGIPGVEISELIIGTCAEAILEGRPMMCADIAHDNRWSDPWRGMCVSYGVLSAHSTPVVDSAGKAIGSVFLTFGEAHEPEDWELNISQMGAHIAGIAIDRDRTMRVLRETEERLATDLADTLHLQSISAEISGDEEPEILYGKVIDAAVAIMKSDFASMQMYYPDRGKAGELRLLAHYGFDPQAAKFWEWVRADSDCTCGATLRSGRRTVVPDILECDWMAGTADLKAYRNAGIRAAQTTPLISRGGKLLGMISTHWRSVHQPCERDFRMLDIVARQAADLIERQIAAERQRQSEEALLKSEKLAAAGRMAATISHEINNPLEAITNLWYLLGQEDLSPEGQGRMKALGEELSRVSHITKQTLEFYRQGNTAARVELSDPIEAAVSLLSRKAESKGARIETDYRASATLFGFAGELRQLFANLVSNAIEAGATTIKIRVSPGQRRKDDERGVYVLVADNGGGISERSALRLFEPFFTTKEEKGTGLGLWVSRGIVQKHDGRIRARSSTRAGRSGTTFRIFLPVMSKEQTERERDCMPIEADRTVLR